MEKSNKQLLTDTVQKEKHIDLSKEKGFLNKSYIKQLRCN